MIKNETNNQSAGHTLHHGDALLVLPTLAAGSVDCIVTDPAYWTLDKWRSVGTTTRLGGHREADKRTGWFDTIDRDELYELICEFYRLLPKNGHAWLCADGEVSAIIQGFVREGETGFDYVKQYPVIKMRGDGNGVKPGMGYHGRATCEYVVLLEKGVKNRRRFTDENWADFFAVPWTGDAESRPWSVGGKPYPTAKPVALMRRLIELYSRPGETILDCFAGSGTTLHAAQQAGRKSIGVDKNADAIELCKRRLAGGNEPAPLFVPGLRMHEISLLHVPADGV